MQQCKVLITYPSKPIYKKVVIRRHVHERKYKLHYKLQAKRHANRNHAWNTNRRRIKLYIYINICVYTHIHVIDIYDICLQHILHTIKSLE